jgi:hypothetical protein
MLKIDWGVDHLCDIIMPLTNVQRVADQQAFNEPSVERTKIILDACKRSRQRLDDFIQELESEITNI